jgi:hypothetical protein
VFDHGIQRAILVIEGAAKLNAGCTLVRKLLFELLHKPGFPNPRLTTHEHDLAYTRFGVPPAPLQ